MWFISVGNVNLDVSMILGGYPAPGVNVVADGLWFGVGGAAVNYSVCIARLGHRVSLVSIVNPLMVKLGLLEGLSRLGVDVSYVRVVDGDPNVAVILMVPGESLRTIVSYRGVSRYLDVSMIPSLGNHVHLASTPARLARDLSRVDSGRVITYDPGGEASRDPLGVRSVIKMVDWIFLNERELEAIVGSRDLSGVAEFIGGRARMVVVKMGARGAAVVTKSEIISFKAPSIGKPVDVVGTGDAFDAAFNVYYMTLRDPGEALRYAIAAGSLKAMLRGSSNMPSRDEIERLASQIG